MTRSAFHARALLAVLLLAAVVLPAWAGRNLAFEPYGAVAGGTVAVAMREGDAPGAAFDQVDAASGGALRRAVGAMDFEGKAGTQLDLPGIGAYDRVLVVGIGDGAASPRMLEDLGGAVGQMAAGSTAPRIELLWDGDQSDAGAHLAFGAELGRYRFDRYRSADAGKAPVGRGELVIRTPAGARAGEVYAAQWAPVAAAVAFARDLVTEPGGAVWPEEFVARTREAFAGIANVEIAVLDVAAMERLGMGGILSVGQGSARPPRLLAVRYRGGRGGDAPIAFVGKGITFDSGGISLKDGDGMWRMKYDMSGAAAATGAVLAIAGRRAPVDVVAVAALAENMPSGTAGRPGDVVRTASGRTFEVMSTDAEGRMVLTDAVWYAQREFSPRAVIDIATLTGSIVTALGDEYAGLFSNDDTLAAQLQAAGAAAGEELWRMPLHPSYAEDLESPIADLRNGGVRGAGAGIGAHFIGSWIEDGMPWAHLDIAGMAWRESEGLPTSPAGATGFGVRLFDRLVRDAHE
ncbi:leucyl aminopeptidase [Luteimonas sp. SJ-92]|uniref:Probable cytosol aminopeptidase n=1 Tax=Luteimonas salinisoli TaxID=2752307 RepID=A0A853JFL1_9GAMM|nr:leucyl aminopeptidase [Luteimonas salinisoli]NZA27367.1 leucyl aminopeptidase [Luteimonas salinisoli]